MIFAYGFAAALAVAFLLFGFHQADPDMPKWAAIHALSICALAWVVWQKRLEIPRAAFFAIGFFVWCAFTLLWSADWRGGVVELVNGAAYLGIFLIVALCDRKKLEVIFPTVGVVALAAFCMAREWPQYFGGFGNENFQTEFALMLIPFLIVGGWKYFLPLALTVYIVFASPSHLKWLAVCSIGSGIVGILWYCGWRWLAGALSLVALNAGLYSGVITNSDLWSSVGARVEITTNTLSMWLTAPFQGRGLGSFNVLYPSFQEDHLKLFPHMGTIFANDIAYFVGAAHDEYAQVLSDFGLIGFCISAAMVWFSIGRPRDRLDWAAYGCLFMASVTSLVGFPLQNPYTGTLAAIALGIACNRRSVVSVRVLRIPSAVLASIVALGMSFVTVKTWKAQQHFSYTQGLLDKDPLVGVLENLRAYQEFGWPRHIRHQLAISVAAALGRDGGSIDVDPQAADAMFAISRSAGGRATAIEVARIEYLIDSGRAGARWQEIEERLTWLKTHAAHQNVTWLAEGKWAVLIQDKKRAEASLKKARSMPNQMAGYTEQVDLLMAAIR